MNDEENCKTIIARMLKRSQTKAIFPLLTLGLVTDYCEHERRVFSSAEIRSAYEKAVQHMKEFLKHDVHIGGRYESAYPSRDLTRYGVLMPLENMQFELLSPFTTQAQMLVKWIPEKIKQHIDDRLGLIPLLGEQRSRSDFAADNGRFLELIGEHINQTPTKFEIFSFAIIKVHLEKFACKIYRDTRTSAHDSGVDLSTNFGVVYQIKKLKVYNQTTADNIYAELKVNFDSERLSDGNVILVIDDISNEIKKYLINMKVQSISKSDILKLASQFEDMEDREKVLRIIYEEFRREYSSTVNSRRS
ncbi:MAG: HaeII family restriction endonuclease [Blastocatellia bacterium]